MARRVSALVGMVALIGLVLMLMWDVYRHHQGTRPRDEPTIVWLRAEAA